MAKPISGTRAQAQAQAHLRSIALARWEGEGGARPDRPTVGAPGSKPARAPARAIEHGHR
jgi:hypothetical protein